jgi:hypothetical protein
MRGKQLMDLGVTHELIVISGAVVRDLRYMSEAANHGAGVCSRVVSGILEFRN